MTQTFTLSQNGLEPLFKEIDAFGRGVVILKGDLAAGKTTLVKMYTAHKGLVDEVTSPTFSLQQCYGDSLYHYDIYNHGLDHFLALGMLEELERDGLHFVEWGDETLKEILLHAGIACMSISIEKIAPTQREYTLCIH